MYDVQLTLGLRDGYWIYPVSSSSPPKLSACLLLTACSRIQRALTMLTIDAYGILLTNIALCIGSSLRASGRRCKIINWLGVLLLGYLLVLVVVW